MSGLKLNRDDFPGYSDEDIIGHYNTFTSFDIDSTGFISPENLLTVLTTMEVKDASPDMVKHIIEEVAILTGHDNDGKLSFRDYMQCVRFDHDAAAHNLALDAQEELRVSVREEEESMRESGRQSGVEPEEATDVSDAAPKAAPAAPAAPPAEPAPEPPAEEETRMRQSSLSIVTTVAAARIKAFQQVADDTAAKNKINAFKKAPPAYSGKMVNSEDMHKASLSKKLKAFETAAKFKGPIEMKKTWKQVGAGRTYAAATTIVATDGRKGPAAKKKITDLP